MGKRVGPGASEKMAPKTQDEWQELLGEVRLLLVDVYSDWAGPCHVMRPLINRLMIQMTQATGKDLLQYATACCDNIPELQSFRNICKPVFLFVAEGAVVGFIHGADSIRMKDKIKEVVEEEVQVLSGALVRKALTMEEAVPPSDLHLDADFDKLEDLEKSKGAAKCFLKKMKK